MFSPPQWTTLRRHHEALARHLPIGRSIHKYNHTIGILQSSTEARSELPIPDTHASCLPACLPYLGPPVHVRGLCSSPQNPVLIYSLGWCPSESYQCIGNCRRPKHHYHRAYIVESERDREREIVWTILIQLAWLEQCLRRFLRIIGRNPNVHRANEFHIVNFPVFFTSSRHVQ